MGGIDRAYVDYLMAFTIVADIIPKCQEYSTFRVSKSPLFQEYQNLHNACAYINFVYTDGANSSVDSRSPAR
jgi:hypothetical protein